LRTCGDGACGLHAVFGHPTREREIYCPHARKLAADLLRPGYGQVSTAITMPKVLADIAMMLWHDYALPYARHSLYGDVAPVDEAMLFMTRLAKKMPRWLEGAIVTAKRDRVAVKKKQELRQRLRIATADIFRVCSEASHIRQLAVDLGDIPSPDRDYLSMSTCDRQALADVYGESAFEYLQPAYRQVGDERIARASDGQLFPRDGPPCAYAALFSEHACFDSLRQRYLDRGAAVDVQGALHGLLGRCPPQSAAHDAVSRLRAAHAEWCAHLVLPSATELPPTFAEEVWPVYVATMENDVGYYFSVDEIVLIANLARVNLVVAAERDSNVYDVVRICDCTPGPFVCVRLLDADAAVVRTHYERIIAAEDVRFVHASALIRQAERAACEREAARMEAEDAHSRKVRAALLEQQCVREAARMKVEDEHSRKVRAALLEHQQTAPRSLPASETDSDETVDELSRLLDEQRDTEADEALREWEEHMREKAPLQPQSDMQSNPRDGTEKEPAAFTHFLLNLQMDSKDPRRAVELALERLASNIRPCPTLPADALNSALPSVTALQEDCATQLPTKHCAFSGCRWIGAKDEELLAHLCAEHVEPLDTVAGLLPAWQKLSDRRVAAYHGAISHVVQGGAPTAAYSIDRRCIYNYAHSMRDDSIEGLVCFSCARRYTRYASAIRNEIRWVSIAELTSAGGSSFCIEPQQLEKILGLETYLQRYGGELGQGIARLLSTTSRKRLFLLHPKKEKTKCVISLLLCVWGLGPGGKPPTHV
jgi:hypothetical protein